MKKIINILINKICDIKVYKYFFLIACFLYNFPFTSVFMGRIFKFFIPWMILIIFVDILKRRKLFLSKEGYILLLMIGFCFLGCFVNYQSNLTSNISVIIYMFIQSVFMLTYDKKENKEEIIKELKLYALTIIVLTLICSVASLIVYLFDYRTSINNGYHEVLIGMFEGRLWSIYGNPNTLGHCSLISIWFSIILLTINNKKSKLTSIICYINIISEWLCIILANSRSTIVGALVSIVVYIIFILCSKYRKKNETILNGFKNNPIRILSKFVMSLIIIFLITFILRYSISSGYGKFQHQNMNFSIIYNQQLIFTDCFHLLDINGSNQMLDAIDRDYVTDDVSNGRFEIWTAGFKVARQNFIFGVGPKNVNEMANKYMSSETVAITPKMTENMHNIYLQILVSHGAIAFILFALFTILIIKNIFSYLFKYKGEDKQVYKIILCYFSILISIYCINLFDSNLLYFFSIFVVPVFWTSISNIERLIKNNDDNKKQKKVLFLIDSLAEGGAEKVLVDLLNNINYKKYNVEVKTIYNEGSYIKQLNKKVKYTYFIKNPNIWKKRIVNRIIKYVPQRITYSLIVNENYDIEIAFLEFLSTKVMSGNISNSLKFAWVHTDIFEHKGSTSLFISKRTLIKAYQVFDKVVCVSNTTKDKFCQETNLYQDTITIYNPIDKNNILKLSKEKCEIKKDKDKFLVVTIGRLNEQKGFLRLCEVINKLKNKYSNIELWIIGKGEQHDILENYIIENELQDYIKLIGFQANPYKYLNQADLFVSSSYVEGYGLVIAEALVLGKPVLSTNTAGAFDILDNGNYGMIVDNNQDAIFNGLDSLLDDKKEVISLKNKAISRQEFFDIKITSNEVESLFSIKDKICKNQKLFCTVFTPTYNRAYCLEKLYLSLKEQKYKNFEWLVIDDGSTDETESLFKKWTKNKNDFEIRYVKVKNGGKQRAINKALELAKGKMFFIVDSDDYLPNDSIYMIKEFEKTISNADNFAGISGYRGYDENKTIGKKIKKEFIDCTNNERNIYNLLGDKAEAYYTDLLKRYKFPEIIDEKFVSENVVWNRIGYDNLKIRWFNKIIYYCDYLEDGLTNQGVKLYKKNPIGYLIFIRNTINYTNVSLKEKLQHYYGYYDAVKENLEFKDIATNLQISKLMLNFVISVKKIKDVIRRRKNEKEINN